MWSEITSWLHWSNATEITTFLITALIAVYEIIHPLIKVKIKNEKNQEKIQTLKIADDLASTIVPELEVMVSLPKSERKKEAIKFITKRLSMLELSLTEETIAAKVEKEYQSYKHSPLE